MKFIIAFALLMLCACARPPKAMFQADKYETVSKLCASSDLTVVGTTARKPYDPVVGLEREPLAEFILLSNGSVAYRLPVGRGGIRSLIKSGDDFIGAKVTYKSEKCTTEFYSITARGALIEFPFLALDLAGMLTDSSGRLTAYGYNGDAWQLDMTKSEEGWHRLTLNANVIRNPLRSIILQKDGRYVVITDKEIMGVSSLTEAPAWTVPYSGHFTSAVETDKLWILTHSPKGTALSHLNTINQSFVKVAEMPDWLAQRLLPLPDGGLLLIASGRERPYAKRGYFKIDTNSGEIIGPKKLPNYTTTECTIDNRLILATNMGAVYEYNIEHD